VAGRIPRQFVDELMARVDIVEVIDERLPLKRQGKDYVACCPFHEEKTPSFSVSPEKQFYYCFGCGAHGTAIGFLMDYAHLGFPEAVEALAERAGMEVPREGGETGGGEDRTPLYDVLQRAARYYRRQLREHPEAARAVRYLKERGLSGEVAAEFGLGFAPPAWDGLLRALGASEPGRRLLARTGLIVEREGGRAYDRFRDRIVFPIRDRRGRVVGFGGRVLGDGTPKYLNSPETPVFHKGRELYGLYEAREHSPRLERLLVVEGYMDVIALAQFGIRNAVASLGTATTREQLEQLFRTARTVVFCFDGDQAGRTAAWRALEAALPLLHDGREVRFLFPPEGEDPDSAVRARGRENFETWVDQAQELTRYLFERLLEEVDRHTLEGRARLVERARPLIERLPPGALRELARQELARLSGLEPDKLSAKLGRDGGSRGRRRRPPHGQHSSPSLVRHAVALLVHHPRLGALAHDTERLRGLDLAGVPLLVELLELLSTQPDLTTGAVLEHFRDREAGVHLAKLAARELPTLGMDLEQEFRDTLGRLERLREEQRFVELTRKLRERSLSEAETQEYRRLLARGEHQRPQTATGLTAEPDGNLL